MRVIQKFLIEMYRVTNSTEGFPVSTHYLEIILGQIIKKHRYTESYLSRLLKMLKNSGEIGKVRTTSFDYAPHFVTYKDRFCYHLTKKGMKRVKYLMEKYNLYEKRPYEY